MATPRRWFYVDVVHWEKDNLSQAFILKASGPQVPKGKSHKWHRDWACLHVVRATNRVSARHKAIAECLAAPSSSPLHVKCSQTEEAVS